MFFSYIISYKTYISSNSKNFYHNCVRKLTIRRRQKYETLVGPLPESSRHRSLSTPARPSPASQQLMPGDNYATRGDGRRFRTVLVPARGGIEDSRHAYFASSHHLKSVSPVFLRGQTGLSSQQRPRRLASGGGCRCLLWLGTDRPGRGGRSAGLCRGAVTGRSRPQGRQWPPAPRVLKHADTAVISGPATPTPSHLSVLPATALS